jgi:hypothetical protein
MVTTSWWKLPNRAKIRLIPVSGALARAQQLLAPYVSTERSLADELIAERRNAALRE